LAYNAAARLAASNYCVPFSEIPYVDMDKPWWDQGSRRDLSIAKQNFLMASDISIGDNDNTWLIYFDKRLIQDLGLEMPYTLVNDGKWTFDKMREMMKSAEFDVDGDGKISMANDRYGFLTHGENYAGMWIAAGQRLITKNADDMPEIAFGNEKFASAWQKIVEIMNDRSCNNNNIEFISTGLANGQTLFGTEILKFVRNYRENEREFGIIPIPKYDEAQENYYTYVAISAPLLIVPVSAPDLERTGIIVEAMAAEGHRTILPAYYEVALKTKYSRDEESVRMLDLIFDGVVYDFGLLYAIPTFDIYQTLLLAGKDSSTFASTIEKNQAKAEKKLQDILDLYDIID
jgi:hypothetical protein